MIKFTGLLNKEKIRDAFIELILLKRRQKAEGWLASCSMVSFQALRNHLAASGEQGRLANAIDRVVDLTSGTSHKTAESINYDESEHARSFIRATIIELFNIDENNIESAVQQLYETYPVIALLQNSLGSSNLPTNLMTQVLMHVDTLGKISS